MAVKRVNFNFPIKELGGKPFTFKDKNGKLKNMTIKEMAIKVLSGNIIKNEPVKCYELAKRLSDNTSGEVEISQSELLLLQKGFEEIDIDNIIKGQLILFIEDAKNRLRN